MPVRPVSRARSIGRNGPFMDTPGLSGGRGMFKRLIVACDGTWLNSDDGEKNGDLAIPSNVTRISRAIKSVTQDGIAQIVNYTSGVGTEGGPLYKLISGTTGKGLPENVREAYAFLANNYHHGDEIFLIGFSRGAFTARSIAGLIGEIGLLTKKGLNDLPEVYEDVQHRRDANYVPKHPDIPFARKPSANDPRYTEELERRGLTRLDIPIKAIAVWDTVGSLGIPRIGLLQRAGLQGKQSRATAFYDTKLSNCVENAFQALALDENRSSFSPAVWEKPEGNRTTLRQVWFPGVHANVGGGYDDMQLANITLAWMMSQLEPFLEMREEYLFEQDALNEGFYKEVGQGIRPWSFGKIYNELKGVMAAGGRTVRTPGQYHAVDPHTGRTTDRPLRQTNEYIHPSVRTRFRLQGPGQMDRGDYEARALTDSYKLSVDYGPNKERASDPEIYWRIKWRDTDAVKILPEAPLWRLERELARKDPDTYDYLKRPPPTKTRDSKRRSQRPMSADMSSRAPTTPGGASVASRRRRDTMTPRSTFPLDEKADARSSRRRSVVERNGRARSRPRTSVYDGGETEIREAMPHRNDKDKAWFDGIARRCLSTGPAAFLHMSDGFPASHATAWTRNLTMAEEMHINAQRAKQLTENIASITSRINAASKGGQKVRLIAVSKLKPANDILALHQPPNPVQTHFGENYVQELLEKSKLLPRTIRWHMIGGLQSNKCKQLAEQIPNLWCVSSVDSAKKATELEKGRRALLGKEPAAEKLRVMVQINTSGEEAKSGVEPADATGLCKHIIDACPHLELFGLMTIGAIARSKATTAENENEDFVCLRETRDRVAKELGWEESRLQLSMGMSADFEGAIKMGSDEVRVGSDIFGERPQKKDAVVKADVAEDKS
ncbi:hypothetical protein SVAN01_08833 [Stagonosporopsis vannaccii]|nr:hypothetical protein SVAN01_08833 [Stagonosporopsis vannaccii]